MFLELVWFAINRVRKVKVKIVIMFLLCLVQGQVISLYFFRFHS